MGLLKHSSTKCIECLSVPGTMPRAMDNEQEELRKIMTREWIPESSPGKYNGIASLDPTQDILNGTV